MLSEEDERDNFFNSMWTSEMRNKMHSSGITQLHDLWKAWFRKTHEEGPVLENLLTSLARKIAEWKKLCAAPVPEPKMVDNLLRLLFAYTLLGDRRILPT
jgi:hypothetical protein